MNDTIRQKQDVLKGTLTSGVKDTMPAQLLDAAGGIIQRIFKLEREVSWGISLFTLVVVMLLPGVIVSLILRETTRNGGAAKLPWLIGVVIFALGVLLSHEVLKYIFTHLRDNVVESIVRAEDLEDLKRHIAVMWDMRRALPIIFIDGFLWMVANLTAYYFFVHQFAGYGIALIMLISGFCAALLLYFLYWLLRLPAHLSKYTYAIYNVDPASSRVVHEISIILNRAALIVAAYTAFASLVTAFLGEEFYYFQVILVLFSWTPTILLFISIQRSLNKIISSAKWKTLQEIQDKISALYQSIDVSTAENARSISELMNLHDRIRKTRNTALDLKTSLSLLNQLMLPILGFLLGNLDKLQRLLFASG